MTITNGYCSLAEYKAWNTIDTINAADDGVIEDIIESVSRQIDGICSRVFFATSATARYFNYCGDDILYTDDISTTTGLIVQIDLDGDGVYESTLSSSDYNLVPYQTANGSPYYGIEMSPTSTYGWSYVKRGNKITAAWGYPSVPDDIKTACLIGVDAEYHARNGQNLSTDTTITGAGVVITPRGLPRSSMEKLIPYRKLF